MKRKTRKILSTAGPSDTIPTGGNNSSPGNALYTLAVIIMFLTFAVYLPCVRNDFISNWDDNRYIMENTNIRTLGFGFFRWALLDYKTNFWHPITWFSHALDYAIWGLNPFGHHLTNIVLHAINTGFVVLLSSVLLKAVDAEKLHVFRDRRYILIASGITGILFGIHPLHVESVAWITERKDLLYAFFYMLSIFCYVRYATEVNNDDVDRPFYSNKAYYLSLLLFFFSLCSKPMAVTLPVVLLLCDWYPLGRVKDRRTLGYLLVEKLPFVVLSALISFVAVISQKGLGSLKSLDEAAFSMRLLLSCKTPMLYLIKVFIPFDLQPLYPFPQHLSLAQPENLIPLFLMFTVTGICIYFRVKYRGLLILWFYFVISLIPVLGIMQTGVAMADRFVYLPSLGPFLLMGVCTTLIWRKTACSLPLRIACVTGAILMVFSLTYLTVRQIGIWKNAVTLWSFVIEKRGNSFSEAYNNRGEAFEKSGQPDRALEDYSKAIAINPKDDVAYLNRGAIMFERGNYDLAIADFSKTISLAPDAAHAYNNRGAAYLKLGDRERAMVDFNTAIVRKPLYYLPYLSRGITLMNSGDNSKAIEDFNKVLELKPDQVKVYVLRGDLYIKTGVVDMALRDYQVACKLGSEAGCRKLSFPFAAGQEIRTK